MKDAGILDGGHGGGRPTKDAPNGSIVVARIEDEATNEPTATVKTLHKEAGRVRLQPANTPTSRSSPPIPARGPVVAVVRLLR